MFGIPGGRANKVLPHAGQKERGIGGAAFALGGATTLSSPLTLKPSSRTATMVA
jgi:hypothetical protein